MSWDEQHEDPALVSVRIVHIDHYLATPIEDLDVTYSNFRSSKIKKVPVLRIFGSTPAGQRTCLHVHGIFPYIYVPVPESAHEGFIYRLAASIDKAINLSLTVALHPDGQQGAEAVEKSKAQHVFKIVEVTGCPFYGYHPREHRFFKIYFYNPWMMKRAADMLVTGAILGQILQPHYSHVPYALQFMMDYNLQGMNFLKLRYAKFRRKAPDEVSDDETSDRTGLETTDHRTEKETRNKPVETEHQMTPVESSGQATTGSSKEEATGEMSVVQMPDAAKTSDDVADEPPIEMSSDETSLPKKDDREEPPLELSSSEASLPKTGENDETPHEMPPDETTVSPMEDAPVEMSSSAPSKTSDQTSPLPTETKDASDSSSKVDENSIRKTSKFERLFDVSKLPDHLLLPESVERLSCCDLEVDGVAADILNTNASLLSKSMLGAAMLQRQPLMNPGLEALCVDEGQRRYIFGINERMTPPSTPPRGRRSAYPSESERFWSRRFRKAMRQMKEKVSTVDPNAPKISARNDSEATVLFEPSKLEVVHAAETPENSDLPAATDREDHVVSLSYSMLETDEGRKSRSSGGSGRPASAMRQLSEEDEAKKEKYFNDTFVDIDILNKTTMAPRRQSTSTSTTQALGGDETFADDADELMSLLQDLGDERDNLLNGTSDVVRRRSRRDEQDELDTLEMSQIIWDEDPFGELLSGELDDDVDEEEESKSEDDEMWEKSFWENINLEELD